jgi:hypothetical protein
MEAAVSNLPNDVEALKALVVSMTRRATDAEAELANARAKASADQALIAHLKLQIAKLNRERFGPHSERIPAPISQPGQVSCRPTPMASSIRVAASPVPCSKPAASPMHGASSSS